MLAVTMIKFSSSKVGIVHKYHNHGLRGLNPSSTSSMTGRNHYSTSTQSTPPLITYVTGKEEPSGYQTIPFIETPQITASRQVLADMLSYLLSINSPLFHFLNNHPRVKYLTSTSPYPVLQAFSVGSTFAAYFSMAVLSVMNPQIMPFSSVYAIGHPLSKEFYLGSRIAGSNRAAGHRQDLRRNLRPTGGTLSLLQEFIVSLGGYTNAV